jgi:hypothetical protein
VPHVHDVIEPSPEKIVLPVVPTLLQPHQITPVVEPTTTWNHGQKRISICNFTAPSTDKSGKIEDFGISAKCP